MKKKKIPGNFQVWIDARQRYHLSHAQVQMARELGMDPRTLGKLANHRQEPWKLPLPEFIEELYSKRFGKDRPDRVMTLEDRVKEMRRKKEEKRQEKPIAQNEKNERPPEGTISDAGLDTSESHRSVNMIVVSTINGKIGMADAMKALKSGGSALDAVEAGARAVERNEADHSVGLGGLPNLLGEVRLDATIMDGRTLRAGAVGSVRGHIHVISLARAVMEKTPHVFLVADGAERLARELGMAEENPLTPEAEARWREGLRQHYPDLDPASLAQQPHLRAMVAELNKSMAGWKPEALKGTVNFLARDSEGNLAAAVSTSGWPWGYPGRLGDSPVVGAGCYADNRYGAAASTGTGEVVLRTSASRSIILYLKMGKSLPGAVQEALKDLRELHDPYVRHIAILALDPSGRHVANSHRPNERYVYMTDRMAEASEAEMINVSTS